MSIHPRVQKAYRAMRQAAVHHPEFLLPFAKIKHLMSADDSGAVPTAAVDVAGRIKLGPTTDDLTLQQTAGRVCHELMHLAMAHFARRGQRDPQRWNIAGDMLINNALKASGMEHPSTWIFLPDEYTGEKTTEAVYAWLATDAGKSHCEGADGSNGCGCGVDADPNKNATDALPTIDGPALAADLIALSKVMGATGRSPIMDLLRPAAPRQNWQAVLKYGVQRAVGGAVRDVRTYARLSRRPMAGITRPGLVSQACNVAVIIDCSGSVDRKWLAQIAAECEKVVSVTAGVGIFLATHTAGLEWSGWVKKGSGAGSSIAKAVAFTGGTNASEAYAAVAKAGRFDVVIHFTDGEIGRWPDVPARAKLIVGLVGSGNYMSKVPTGALVIPIAS